MLWARRRRDRLEGAAVSEEWSELQWRKHEYETALAEYERLGRNEDAEAMWDAFDRWQEEKNRTDPMQP